MKWPWLSKISKLFLPNKKETPSSLATETKSEAKEPKTEPRSYLVLELVPLPSSDPSSPTSWPFFQLDQHVITLSYSLREYVEEIRSNPSFPPGTYILIFSCDRSPILRLHLFLDSDTGKDRIMFMEGWNDY